MITFRTLCLLAGLSLLTSCGGRPPNEPQRWNTVEAPLSEAIATQAGAIAATPPAPVPPQPTLEFPTSLAGLRIAFIRDGQLWLWHAGMTTRLTESVDEYPSPRISGDGELIAFTRNGELWSIRNDGTGERLLVPEAFIQALGHFEHDDQVIYAKFFHIEWIPNKHSLLFNTYFPTIALPSDSDDLHRVNVDTQQVTTLLPVGEGGPFLPSPDGEQISIVTPAAILLMNIDGSHIRASFAYTSTVIGSHHIPMSAQPRWAPDSQSLLVTLSPSVLAFRYLSEIAVTVPTTLWRIPTDGSRPEQIAQIPLTISPPPLVSPDGARIAFLLPSSLAQDTKSNLPVYELHLANIDLSDDTLYYDGHLGRVGFFQWTPDSEHFVFSTRVSKTQGDNWLGKVGDDYLPFESSPDWIDSIYFLYKRQESKHHYLRLGRLDTPDQAGPILIEDFRLYDAQK